MFERNSSVSRRMACRRPSSKIGKRCRSGRTTSMFRNCSQWLQFRNIEVVRPDLQRFPIFDEGLRQAMRRETEEFLSNIVRNDVSVLDLLDAKYTFLNERLARFYGIPGVTGPEFRRV